MNMPRILPQRDQAAVVHGLIKGRLETILPAAMRESGFDMWLIICQEDNPDPIFSTMCPMNTWCPILQMLIFFDTGTEIERINLSMTDMQGLFQQPWKGTNHSEQWAMLAKAVKERAPKRIGINIGSIQWAAGGLTQNLYQQLVIALPQEYVERLESAEPMVVHWAGTLTGEENELYETVTDVAKAIIAECFSTKVVTPGVTTTDDIVWHYRQRAADLGLDLSFPPFFIRRRSEAMQLQYGSDDPYLRAGDFFQCDVGIKYFRLCSDHQQWCYLLLPGETDAPAFAYEVFDNVHRLQDIFRDEFRVGLTGNEMLTNILSRARREEVPNPRIYSHNLGLFLHQPGPLIGLPWEQERCEGRGDVVLRDNMAFTMELSVSQPMPEWGGNEFRMSVEEMVVFTGGKCRLIDERQAKFHLI
jgi:hypothetical protein